jgi:hypothetical protein
MEAIFGADAKGLSEALPQGSALYSSGGKAIEIGWRTYAKAQLGSLKGGRLRGVKIKDRLAVIYSPEDLSVGLVGQPIDGIVGYEPQTASALMANALVLASKGAVSTAVTSVPSPSPAASSSGSSSSSSSSAAKPSTRRLSDYKETPAK